MTLPQAKWLELAMFAFYVDISHKYLQNYLVAEEIGTEIRMTS